MTDSISSIMGNRFLEPLCYLSMITIAVISSIN